MNVHKESHPLYSRLYHTLTTTTSCTTNPSCFNPISPSLHMIGFPLSCRCRAQCCQDFCQMLILQSTALNLFLPLHLTPLNINRLPSSKPLTMMIRSIVGKLWWIFAPTNPRTNVVWLQKDRRKNERNPFSFFFGRSSNLLSHWEGEKRIKHGLSDWIPLYCILLRRSSSFVLRTYTYQHLFLGNCCSPLSVYRLYRPFCFNWPNSFSSRVYILLSRTLCLVHLLNVTAALAFSVAEKIPSGWALVWDRIIRRPFHTCTRLQIEYWSFIHPERKTKEKKEKGERGVWNDKKCHFFSSNQLGREKNGCPEILTSS